MSFVVAWQGCPTQLSRRLGAWNRWVDASVDVVVACSISSADRQQLEGSYPSVRLVNAGADEELTALRQLGFSFARGDIVVIIDDTVGSSSSWRDHLPAAITAAVPPAQAAQWARNDFALRAPDDATSR